MKKWLTHPTFFLSLLFLFSQCRDSFEMENIQTESPPSPIITQQVAGDVYGMVVDENDFPLAGAAVKLGNETQLTDDNGLFRFRNQAINQGGTYLLVNKAGYFSGSTLFLPNPDRQHFRRIKLLEKSPIGSFPAGTGGEVQTPDGLEIRFPPSSIAGADGTPYTGTVEVAARRLDPTSADLSETMPGNLLGLDKNDNLSLSATFGMLAVELTAPGGEELNLVDGLPAQLSLPVPIQLQNMAPNEISLCHFDEQSGLWLEKSSARLENGTYVGEVPHFSFWNFNLLQPLTILNGRVVNVDDNPVPNIKVCISGNYITKCDYTDNQGEFSGYVPEGQELVLQVLNVCDEPLKTENLGSLPGLTNLGNLVLDPDSTELVQITGEVIDCDGNPVQSGLVMIRFANEYVLQPLFGDNLIDFIFDACTANELEVQAYSFAPPGQSAVQAANVQPSLSLGQISVCDSLTGEYFRMNVEGEEYVWADGLPSAGYSPAAGSSYISLPADVHPGLPNAFLFYFPGNTTGNYADVVEVGQMAYGDLANCLADCGFTSFEITAFGEVGEYIEGGYAGEISILESTGEVLRSVSGDFRVIRDE